MNGGVWKSIDAGRVWDAGVRFAAGRVDRRDCRRAVGAGCRVRGQRRVDAPRLGGLSATACTSRPTRATAGRTSDSTTRSTSGRSRSIRRIPNVVFVAAIGQLYAANAERGVFRSRDGGKSWEKVLFKGDDVGAVEVVIDPSESASRVRGPLEHAPSAVVHVRADQRPGRRHLQIDRRRHDVDAAHERAAEGRNRPQRDRDRAERFAARLRGGRLSAAGARAAPAHSPHRSPAERRTSRCRGRADSFARTMRGATWTRLSSDQALWGRGWYFEKLAVDPKDADIVYVTQRLRVAHDGRRQALGRAARLAGRRRLPSAVGLARRHEHDDRRERSGRDHHAQREGRDAKTVTWSSWLNQPTAQMYHISVDYRSPYWVTGAQQDSGAVAVRSRGKFAEISMRDWEPIGAGWRERLHGGRPAASRASSSAARASAANLATNKPLPGTTAPKTPEARRSRRLDAAARVLEGRSARAVLREPVSLQEHRRREDVDEDQRRPHARGPRRAGDARRGGGGAHRSERQARRHLHDRAVAAAGADALDRHRRRLDLAHERRRRDAGRT